MQADTSDIDRGAPPFDRFRGLHHLSSERSGHASIDHVRHRLYAGRDKRTNANMLIKLSAKPGLVYQQPLANEIASLTTINRELARSRYFPLLDDHGQLRDGRRYLVITLFDELPLETVIGPERIPARLVAYLRAAIEVTRALTELHGLGIFHVDLNPMNILYRTEGGRPVIRIVDFESSYEVARHGAGEFYNPPTTSRYSAPEVSQQGPDARSDLYSLGAVLYTLLAGYEWTWTGEAAQSIAQDPELDEELRHILLRASESSPAARYDSAGRLRTELTAYLERIWPGRDW
jgi:serine/threonine-protein kinase